MIQRIFLTKILEKKEKPGQLVNAILVHMSYEPNLDENVSHNTLVSPRVIFITTDIVSFQEK